ncbi:MAG: YkgJ family cysteine cluster protein [Solidesulfovibrio sp. DCME]|uniref:YkgJ family cysteine cluster protein n=1 Tax=Solidesulfovibrio sp. DCME TaxID=3447380 RepID=UPI003D09AD27
MKDLNDALAEGQADATEAFLESLPELAAGETFRFACHPQVPCFNACCSDLTLMLTPYDVLRLRRALGVSSADFLTHFAHRVTIPDSGFPMPRLKMREERQKRCPFVSAEGCKVYGNRPGACRTYPLGRASRLDEAGNVMEQFFVVREPHCQGFEEEANWDAAAWLADQELAVYNAANDRYMRLMALARGKGARLTSKQEQMVWLALYQPDAFQDFIAKMDLFRLVEIDEGRKAAVAADEEAALAFGLDWLELAFFGIEEGLRRKRPPRPDAD